MTEPLQIRLPDSKVAGTYADGVRMKHNRNVFTLDFVAATDAPGDYIVAERIRLDPSAVQGVLAQLSAQLNAYEQAYGDPRPDTAG